MNPLMMTLLAGSLILPLMGCLWLIVTRESHQHARRLSTTALTIAGFSTLCAIGLLWIGEHDVALPTWIPTTGPMSLHVGGLGTQVAAATTATLFLSLLLAQHTMSWSATALLLAALSAANGAFLAGHFLLRYLALELVGLCVGLAPLLASKGDRLQQAKRTYLSLRLGDVGLLTAILILWHASGTLVIGPAIAAADQLPSAAALWTVGGLLLAVWVKVGLWPFHRWQATATDLPPPAGAWLFGSVMPNLGLYLLYRSLPLLQTTPRLLWISVVLAVLGLLRVVVIVSREPRSLIEPPTLSALISAFAVLSAASGRSDALAAILLVATPCRAAAWLSETAPDLLWRPLVWTEDRSLHPDRRRLQSAEGTIIAIANWSSLRVERRIAQDGVTRLWQLLFAFARWLHLGIETRIAHEGPVRAWHFFTGAAQTWHRVGEERLTAGIVRGTAQGAISISHWLQKLHTGKLRINQRWTVATLVLMVSLVVLIGW